MLYLRASLLLFFALSIHSTAGLSVRGVHPDLSSRYQTASGTFTCLDGSKSIPSTQLNDNYCDCADGTDEPGTSACPNSTFYCKNPGFQEKQLPSQFVDDGVCDCCDGTDEQPGKCKNSCFEASAAMRQEIRDKAMDVLGAVQKRSELVAEAASVKSGAAARRKSLEEDIAKQEEELQKLEEELKRLEEEEEKQRQLEEQRREQAEAAAQQQPEAAEEEVLQEGGEETTTTIDGAVSAGEEHEEHAEGEVDTDELGKKIAAQWTHDPAAVGEDEASWEHDHHDFDHHDEAAEWDDHHAQDSSSAVADARWKSRDAKRRLEELKKERSKLDILDTVDLGPGNVFWHLAGNCYTGSDMRFTYDVCFFESATQKEGGGRWGLGSWEGFKDNYKLAVFSGGEQCWDGPKRSLTLELECGKEVKVHSPAEPSTCVYTAKLVTPAACEEKLEGEMKQALANLDLLEQHASQGAAPVHDEL